MADAKDRFSEVVKKALLEGPQRIRPRGEDALVCQDEFDRLMGAPTDFKKFLFEGPRFDDLESARDRTPFRDGHL